MAKLLKIAAYTAANYYDIWLKNGQQGVQAFSNSFGILLPDSRVVNVASSHSIFLTKSPPRGEFLPALQLAIVFKQHMTDFTVGKCRVNFTICDNAAANPGAKGYIQDFSILFV